MKLTVEMIIDFPEDEDPIGALWRWMQENKPKSVLDWQIVAYDEGGELV